VGVIAYWRSLPITKSSWQRDLRFPVRVKKLVQFMQRTLQFAEKPVRTREAPPWSPIRTNRVQFIWTGRVEGGDCLVKPELKGCPYIKDDLGLLDPFGADCAALNKRQEGASCAIPGGIPDAPGGGGDGESLGTVTYKPGSPSPTCLTGCGVLCTGFWCTQNPTGHPPGFYDPKDPNHQQPTTSPTPTNLPPLPSNPTTCPRPWSSTQVCNGSGGKSVCVTSSVCPPPPSLTPVPTTTNLCSSGQLCVSTTVFTLCQKRDAPAEETAAPRAALPAQADSGILTAVPTTTASPVAAAPPPPPSDLAVLPKSHGLLEARQKSDPCQYFTRCATCATPVSYPCLEMSIIGAGDFFYNIWEAKVIEDGRQVCAASFTCPSCQGRDDMPCEDGGSFSLHINKITFKSGKYKQTFEYILPETKYEEYACGLVVTVFKCDRHWFSQKGGPCNRGKRALQGLDGSGFWAPGNLTRPEQNLASS
jgi:hypothetical protein